MSTRVVSPIGLPRALTSSSTTRLLLPLGLARCNHHISAGEYAGHNRVVSTSKKHSFFDWGKYREIHAAGHSMDSTLTLVRAFEANSCVLQLPFATALATPRRHASGGHPSFALRQGHRPLP